ncbi:MAG: hypothetical protein JF612_09600 [Planctomycetia bacterium]|nr:hypothetical protein [Planctomycetia bacterium]
MPHASLSLAGLLSQIPLMPNPLVPNVRLDPRTNILLGSVLGLLIIA